MFVTLAITHKTMRMISFAAYDKAKYGLLRNVRYTARKLVVTESVLGMIFAVLKELMPEITKKGNSRIGTIAFVIGFSCMMMLDVALG